LIVHLLLISQHWFIVASQANSLKFRCWYHSCLWFIC